MPATFASATISTAPVARHELLEQVDRPDPNIDRRSGEDYPVRVVRVGPGIRDRLVHGQPFAKERVERLVVDRQRTPTLARPLPRGLGVDLEQHGERATREQLPRVGREHCAAAERDHRRLRPVECGRGNTGLDQPESRLAVAREDVLDRRSRLAFDLPIEIDEGPAEPARDVAPERRLARAHEAGEREVSA